LKRVVITGLGIVSSIGNDTSAVLSSLKNHTSGLDIWASLKPEFATAWLIAIAQREATGERNLRCFLVKYWLTKSLAPLQKEIQKREKRYGKAQEHYKNVQPSLVSFEKTVDDETAICNKSMSKCIYSCLVVKWLS
jgi:3-oxoacyl-(acyl-carrier-protein) synthase